MPFATPLREWQALQLKTAIAGPDLFYSLQTTSNSLQLLVTDLTSVWETDLDRDQLIEHARDQSCSIDPSESTSQLKTLLSKLSFSLNNGNNTLLQSKQVVEANFGLYTSIRLPAPLQPLRWSFSLVRSTTADYARDITIPILEELSASAQRLESLSQVIKEKDHVITKLLDKIEASAIDLSLIFPGIAGLKSRKYQVSVAEAIKHVPGLGNFDHELWSSENGTRGLSNALTKTDNSKNLKPSSDKWWENLPSVKDLEGSLVSKPDTPVSTSGAARRPPRETDDRSTSSEDDFEVGRTINKASSSPQQPKVNPLHNSPLKARKQALHRSRSKSTTSSTASDSDSNSDVPVSPAPKPNKLGTVGKVKSSRRKPVPGINDGNATASSDSSSADSDSDVKPKGKAVSKLGKLGGRKKTSRSPAPAAQQTSSAASTPARHKLGMIRRSRTSTPAEAQPTPSKPSPASVEGDIDLDSDATASSCSAASTPASKPALIHPPPELEPEPESEPEPETEEQAASRRREELKRTLNAGGGAKKRRRF